MPSPPLTVNIMTATLAPGDAIGNYILTKARILRDWGVRVRLYADFVDPAFAGVAGQSALYQDSGTAILWYHYSLYADNVAIARRSRDFTIMDYHGVSPPYLFKGRNAHLAHLCQKGIDLLPDVRDDFDLCVVHSEYARGELMGHGYAPAGIHKLPLVVDTTRFDGEDATLARSLSKLTYFLFVGRLVPQKDILAMLEIFARVNRARPGTVLILVGSAHLSDAYRREIDAAIRRHHLGERVLFTGQVNDAASLAALFRHAHFLFVTSEWESFCVPLVEAMHFGTPPVVHRVPPLPEVAGPAGVVIDKHKPDAAADQVLALLDDPAQLAGLRSAAAERAAAFTDDALAAALLQMLQDVFLT